MRADHGLSELLQYENIAWYADGTVRMLDRRVYPSERRYVTCRTHQEVTKAIRDMVTQSYGPFHAAAMGMVLAAHECAQMGAEKQKAYLTAAGDTIANARPTTAKKMRVWTDAALSAGLCAIHSGESPEEAMFRSAIDRFDQRYARIAKIGRYLSEQVPMGGTVMTQCYADCDLGMLLRALREANNPVRFFTPETRPYLQGARLTASVIYDMGFDVTVITDNMPGYILKNKQVDVFTSAADVICMDGHVVNKVGTFQIALSANYLGIPYYVTGFPDATHQSVDSVHIEERDPEEVVHAMGRRTAKEGVKGCYPAFDITPPALVKGVVTDQGILPAEGLDAYRFA